MSSEIFTTISSIINKRRTVVPEQMNGQLIPDADIVELLELAQRAPSHGITQAWRFSVYSGSAKNRLFKDHAEMYKQVASEQDFVQSKYDKLFHRADNASHVIAIGVKCGTKSNIPDIEEVASVSCAVMSMWLAATAKGFACYWGTGGMTYHPLMRDYQGLDEGDQALGFFFLGHSDFNPLFTKRSPLHDRVKFISK